MGHIRLLVYADDVNLLGDNVDTTKNNTETLIAANKEAGLEEMQRKLNVCCCLVTRMQGKVMT
jgi:hypothetical protein